MGVELTEKKDCVNMIIRLECEINGAVEEMDVSDSMSLSELKMLACVQFLGVEGGDEYELVFQNRPIGKDDMASTTLLQNNIPNNCVIKLRKTERNQPVTKKAKGRDQEDFLASAMGSF